MEKQLLCVVLILYLFSSVANAQDSLAISKGKVFKKKNTIYAELGGRSVIYSINYDRIFWQNKWLNASAKVGFTYFNTDYLFPVSLALFTGKKKGHFELSYSTELTPSQAENPPLSFMTFGAGYRYQNPTGKGLFFSATSYLVYSPISLTSRNIHILPWVGIGIGKSF